MHNTLRKDRYVPTNYQEELSLLGIKSNGAYTFDESQMIEKCGCQVVAEGLPSGCHSIDKNRLVEDSVGKGRGNAPRKTKNSNIFFGMLEGED